MPSLPLQDFIFTALLKSSCINRDSLCLNSDLFCDEEEGTSKNRSWCMSAETQFYKDQKMSVMLQTVLRCTVLLIFDVLSSVIGGFSPHPTTPNPTPLHTFLCNWRVFCVTVDLWLNVTHHHISPELCPCTKKGLKHFCKEKKGLCHPCVTEKWLTECCF